MTDTGFQRYEIRLPDERKLRLQDMFAFTDTLDLTSSPKLTSIRGFHIAENAGSPAAATVNIRNGGASGDVFVQVELGASESKHFGVDRPLPFGQGVYVEVAAGTVRGSIVPG